MDHVEVAREYYRTIDEDDYETLRSLLAPGFVQARPDRTFEGVDRFVAFMREERPMTNTSHAIDVVYQGNGEVAVRGRLLRDDEELFGFVDVFSFEEEDVDRIRTYTQRGNSTD